MQDLIIFCRAKSSSLVSFKMLYTQSTIDLFYTKNILALAYKYRSYFLSIRSKTSTTGPCTARGCALSYTWVKRAKSTWV